MKLLDPSLFDNLLEAVLIVDKDFGYIYSNSQFNNFSGLNDRRLKNRDLSSVLPLKEWILRLSMSSESEITLSDGEKKHVQVCTESIEIEEKKCWFFYIRDVSVEGGLQAKYRAELKDKEVYIQQLNRKLFEMSVIQEISFITNLRIEGAEIFQKAVELLAQKFNLQKLALIETQKDKNPVVVAAIGLPFDDPYWIKSLTEVGLAIKITAQATKSTSGCLLIDVLSCPSDEDQRLLSTVATQLIARVEQETLYFSSITDEKTKLFNARYLRSTLDREIQRCRRWGESLGLIVVDIDHFKKFNDTYGHQVGDQVLVHVAEVLKLATRTTDIVARFGGEEFCVIATKADKSSLHVVMERIRSSIEKSPLMNSEHGLLKVTVSVGGAVFPQQSTTQEDLFEKADQALYESKRNGRNQIRIWNG